MLFFTQLIYINEGKEDLFHQFEDMAIPLISKYNGQLLLRIRPAANAFISEQAETPYEVHIVQFPAEADFENFSRDETRKQFLHLKEASVKSVVLLKGVRL